MGLGISENKLKHSIAVARFMRKAAEDAGWSKQKCEEMFVLGLLHDIGYEFSEQQSEHAGIGGELLQKQGYRYWQEIAHHGNPHTEYSSIELDLLNTADLQVDAKGNVVGVRARLEDIASRYGRDSRQYTEAKALAQIIGLI